MSFTHPKAAERRIHQQESRGVKNPESVKRAQQKAIELEKEEQRSRQDGGPALRWAQD